MGAQGRRPVTQTKRCVPVVDVIIPHIEDKVLAKVVLRPEPGFTRYERLHSFPPAVKVIGFLDYVEVRMRRSGSSPCTADNARIKRMGCFTGVLDQLLVYLYQTNKSHRSAAGVNCGGGAICGSREIPENVAYIRPVDDVLAVYRDGAF